MYRNAVVLLLDWLAVEAVQKLGVVAVAKGLHC
jgi:hypothetical protein